MQMTPMTREGVNNMTNNSTPLRGIRIKCLDCSCDSYKEVELCPIHDCGIYPFRFGAMPATVERRLREGKTPSGRPRKRRPEKGDPGEDGLGGILCLSPGRK